MITQNEMVEDSLVDDDAANDETILPLKYEITSFGADYDVEGLVRRLNKNEIRIPEFQRSFIWTQAQGSRFVESLLLGLPVPGIFLTRDPETSRLEVIDGQQRLKTLQFFYNGVFNPKYEEKTRKVFTLEKVQPQFLGKTYENLSAQEKRNLDNSIIHATIVKQDSPEDDDTSIYHLFERLNTKQTNLVPQEIRAALYQGPFDDLIKELNKNTQWRSIFGKESLKLKDRELILRFLALFFESGRYVKPMADFLSKFMKRHANKTDQKFLHEARWAFTHSIAAIHSAIGDRSFRLASALNAAVFDSVMVGVARRLEAGNPFGENELLGQYETLLKDDYYLAAVTKATSDEGSVKARIQLSIDFFKNPDGKLEP